ncbi:hypothetical protein IWQ60_000668 [Tieghemiomyces parasiticus]|uniref:Dynein intermediate chain n=1 Tax=Tieghemiomyces parasiticus TaxID=78921 RepID=A0A9W8E2L6_9FUNG|nr:hypothetical protein IWQ60_000668 [Tieghemiomyces parasiticus]
MADRREEILRKQQRLAEIRRMREERRQALLTNRPGQAAAAPGASTRPSAPGAAGRQDIDDLVASLVGERRGSLSPTRSRAPSISQTLAESGRSYSAADAMRSGSVSPIGEELVPGAAAAPAPAAPPAQPVIPEFSTFDAVILDLPPKERLAYSKESQTVDVAPETFVIPEEEIERRVQEQREKDEKARHQAEEQERKRQEELAKQRQRIKQLSEDEKLTIEQSSEFTDFIDHSSRLVERALNETYDFMTDYTIGQQGEVEDGASDQIKLYCCFADERRTKNRSVTDVAWSKKFPELLASSYNRNPLAVNEPDGLACVWNVHLKDRPEFVFHSQSDLLRVAFSDFHPNLLVGGSYAGQILLWDTRAKSEPVLKTPLSAAGHTHPVYSLEMVGTQNAHNLVTASTDGVVCTWQLDMLAQPQELLELIHPSHPRTDEVAPTAMGFPDGETDVCWIGTEEGNVYQVNRHDRADSKAGLNVHEVYRGHGGPVTGLHFHPLFGPVDYTDLFLTCSVDWTVKLWRARSPSKPSIAGHRTTPLHSFEAADDYVYDVKWSPLHPAVFGSVDGAGRFDLWNLNVDTEVPVLSTPVGTGRALNRLAWDKTGRRTALGSVDGNVYVYEMGDLVVPKSHDFAAFQRTVQDLAAPANNATTSGIPNGSSVAVAGTSMGLVGGLAERAYD